MKRSSFRKQTLEEIKAKQAVKRATRSHRMPQDKSKVKKAHKVPHKGYKPPKWFNSIKLGSHGNTPAQKRFWTAIREKYLQEDFEQFGGKCVTCNLHLERWQDGQLAHYKAWAVCNAWFKYDRKNLRLSCANCNRLSDGVIGKAFADALIRQYGQGHLEWIEQENLKYRGQKLEVWQIVEKVAELRPDLVVE